jgi:hypothetical protein
MNLPTLVFTFIGSSPALLFFASVLLYLVNKKPAEDERQAIGEKGAWAAIMLMLCLLAILLWMVHKLYPVGAYALNWWHLSWASILLVWLVRSIRGKVSSVSIGILLLVPLGFLSVAALSFLNSKTVSGMLMVLCYSLFAITAYRKSQILKNLPLASPASTASASSEAVRSNNIHTPVDPAALELRLKSQEANEGADKYTRE